MSPFESPESSQEDLIELMLQYNDPYIEISKNEDKFSLALRSKLEARGVAFDSEGEIDFHASSAEVQQLIKDYRGEGWEPPKKAGEIEKDEFTPETLSFDELKNAYDLAKKTVRRESDGSFTDIEGHKKYYIKENPDSSDALQVYSFPIGYVQGQPRFKSREDAVSWIEDRLEDEDFNILEE
jgi:hypothetical protein